MNSMDEDFMDHPRTASCLLCQNVYTDKVSCENTVYQKVVQICTKYLKSTTTENNVKKEFNSLTLSLETGQQVICPPCFEYALRLSELNDQLKIVQKSINDLLLTFSTTVIGRRIQGGNGTQRPDVSKIPCVFNLLNETNLPFNDEASPLVNGESCLVDVNSEIKIEPHHTTSDDICDEVYFNLDGSPEIDFNNDNESIDELATSSSNKNSVGCRKGNRKHLGNELELRVHVGSERLSKRRICSSQSVPLQGSSGAVKKCSLKDNVDQLKPEIVQEDSSNLLNLRISKKLQKHPRSDLGIQSYSCLVCDKYFGKKNKLKIHLQTHTGEKSFKCLTCPKAFTHSHHLTRHNKTHTGEKPFMCSSCPKRFTQKSDLTKHTRTHTGEKPFKCTVCSLAFLHYHHLTRHTRTHTGEKPYKCPQCPKTFAAESSYNEHKIKHMGEKQYLCSSCPKAFFYSASLRNHLTTHSGERPFQCSYCGKCLKSNTELTIHTRIHTGEKTHNCSICSMVFSKKSNLERHMRTHT